jgi:hypothetical protein
VGAEPNTRAGGVREREKGVSVVVGRMKLMVENVSTYPGGTWVGHMVLFVCVYFGKKFKP